MAVLDSLTKYGRYKQALSEINKHSFTPGDKCLNAGGDYGYFSDILSKKGFDVTTCDLSGDCDFCDLNNILPYKDNSFELVVCTAVLEHLNNYELAMSELIRVSSKLVVITTPSIYGKPVLEFLAFLRLVDAEHIADHKYYLKKSDIESKGFKHKYFQFGLNQFASYKS